MKLEYVINKMFVFYWNYYQVRSGVLALHKNRMRRLQHIYFPVSFLVLPIIKC